MKAEDSGHTVTGNLSSGLKKCAGAFGSKTHYSCLMHDRGHVIFVEQPKASQIKFSSQGVL